MMGLPHRFSSAVLRRYNRAMRTLACLPLVVLIFTPRLPADVKPAALFADDMVLQRDMPMPIWGTADAGEAVSISIAGHQANATADTDGHWLARFNDPLQAGGPFEMIVRGKQNTLTLKNVLVGEVWIAGGQSNMEMHLDKVEGGPAAAAANDPRIRFFKVGGALPATPSRELHGQWQTSNPQNAKDWSAAGYFFARDLHAALGVPVGIIQNAVGWTPAEAWTSRAALVADPELKPIMDRWDQWAAASPKAKQIYAAGLAEWKRAAEQARTEGKAAPPEPPAPANPDFIHHASLLFNGMLHPLIPCAFRGVIWYQGETNASRAEQYRRLFPAMIRDWREQWHAAVPASPTAPTTAPAGDFPFIFVQIAPLDAGPIDRAELREAQRETLAQVRNAAMVVTVDIGMQKDEHPKNKLEVGRRLSLAAQKLAYGKAAIASGPVYRRMKIEGASIRLTFDDLGGGLVSKPGPRAEQSDGTKLIGFTIAGADQKFVPADARIDGDTVVVSSASITQPTAVRYAFANWPQYSLFNKAGLPASPFRTDDFPFTTKGESRMFYDRIGLDDVTLTPKK